MKKVLLAAVSAMLALALGACSLADEPAHVYALKGPTGIGMTGMMRDHADAYEFTLCGGADEIVAAIASGSADIAACPTNLAATLYGKTNGGVRLLALNTLGVLHVVTSDASIQSAEDLAGRTVYATGQASVPEYVIDYILEQKGLTDSVKIEYVAEHSELAAMLAAGKVETGILPEPHVTSAMMQSDDLRAALDVTALFEEAARAAGNEDMVLSMGCVIVRAEFAADHPEQVAAFMDHYAASVQFVNTDTHEAAQQAETFGVMPKAAAAERAIPNCHIVFVEGAAMRAQIEPLYALLFDANPASIGGAMPGDDFYYVR